MAEPAPNGLDKLLSQADGGASADEICKECATFEVILVTHLADEYDFVGHAFVAVDQPTADCSKSTGKLVRGFYPKKEQDPLSVMWEGAGAPANADGIVKDDGKYFTSKPTLYAEKKYIVSCSRAQAAVSFIKNREGSPGVYSLWTRQCSHFALDVLRAAGIDVSQYIPDSGPVRPSYIYSVLTKQSIPAARWPPRTGTEEAIRGAPANAYETVRGWLE